MINRLLRYPAALAMRARIVRLRLIGVHVGRRCWIRTVQVPRNPWDIVLGCDVKLDDYVVLLATGPRTSAPKLVVGDGTYFNRFTVLDASRHIEFGRNCMIGPYCYVSDHDWIEGPQSHPTCEALEAAPVVFGNDVWLGAGVLVLKGVTVGHGAVIGAGAVITEDVAPYAKIVGIPARAIGFRRG